MPLPEATAEPVADKVELPPVVNEPVVEEVVVDTSNEKQVAKATQDAFAGAFDLGLQEETKASEPVKIEEPELVPEPEPEPVPEPEPDGTRAVITARTNQSLNRRQNQKHRLWKCLSQKRNYSQVQQNISFLLTRMKRKAFG